MPAPPGQARPAHRPEKNHGAERFFGDWPAWAARLLVLLGRSWRFKIVGRPDPGQAAVFAHWHGDDLVLLAALSSYESPVSILVSLSRDGAILSRVIEVLGHSACRGSSSRGGADGLLALKRALNAGRSAVFAADGPRGPRLTAKPGPAWLAAKTGRPLRPVGVAVSSAFVFKGAWNFTRLPLPGARVVIAFGPPLELAPEAARWPAHRQSRLAGAALADAARAAELELAAWRGRSGGRLK